MRQRVHGKGVWAEMSDESGAGSASGKAGELVATADAFRPAVPVDGLTGDGCAAYPDFCFFCEYAAAVEDESDPRYALAQLVNLLLGQGATLEKLVAAVHRSYTLNVKDDVVWHNPATDADVTAPEWSKASIARHLVNDGGEFPGIFDVTVDRIMRKVALELNNQLISTDTERVDLSTLKAFRETVEARSKWNARCGLGGPMKATARKTAGRPLGT